MSFSDYLEDELLDHIFGCGTRDYTFPTNLYVGLSTADPTDDDSGLAEPSGSGYARVETDGADWNAASSGAVTNANSVQFPEASASWGTVSHFFIADASTDGNILASGALTSPEEIVANKIARFAAGDFSVTLD